ncbi:MAG: hypothetical protein KBD63_01720 [Bacteriovoracaceae bacterium]|nr:hypothetical protein [Bacteriovoracaceae bacterium]
MSIIFLDGFMASGKSTFLKMFASLYSTEMTCLDLDTEIEKEVGEGLQTYIERVGEDFFRIKEQEVLTQVLSSFSTQKLLLALGGGSLQKEEDELRLRRIRTFKKVWLDVPLEVCLKRIYEDGHRYFSNRSASDLALLYERRCSRYQKCDLRLSLQNINRIQLKQVYELSLV